MFDCLSNVDVKHKLIPIFVWPFKHYNQAIIAEFYWLPFFPLNKCLKAFANGWLFTSVQAAVGTMDFIIDTVSAVHPLAPLIALLKLNGKLITVGLPNKPLELPIFPLVLGKPRLP